MRPVHAQLAPAFVMVELAAFKEVLHACVGGVGGKSFFRASAELLQHTHEGLVLFTAKLGASGRDSDHPSTGTNDTPEFAHGLFKIEPVQRTSGADQIDRLVCEPRGLRGSLTDVELGL